MVDEIIIEVALIEQHTIKLYSLHLLIYKETAV